MIEKQIQQSMFSGYNEKTFIDKVLGKEDIKEVRKLMKKENLTRQDLNDLLNLLSSTEQKLLNYGEWERYHILKFFVWVRETLKVTELLFDYEDDMNEKNNLCSTCKKEIITKNGKDKCTCSIDPKDIEYNLVALKYNSQVEFIEDNYNISLQKIKLKQVQTRKMILSDRALQMFHNIKRQMEHNLKFMVDLYFNISRTTLSIQATGIFEILRNKYEVSYPENANLSSVNQQPQNKVGGLFKR